MVDLHVPLRQGVLFAVGGALYYLVEVLWRGHSDWTMAVLGGVCFLLCGINKHFLQFTCVLSLFGRDQNRFRRFFGEVF